MKDSQDGKTRLIAYGYDGKPIALIEMWLEERKDTETQATIVTLHSKVATI